MDSSFWLERWQSNQIGFHQSEINRYLTQFWTQLNVAAPAQVFVPLCGKSKDMLWLRAQGYSVLGVELSELACRAFFTENELSYIVERRGAFDCYIGDGIEILCGDLFQMQPAQLAAVQAVYDRASWVALPPQRRSDYVAMMQRLLPVNAKWLLVTMEYAQSEMEGPPFSVAADEVMAAFPAEYHVVHLWREDVLAENERFRARGVTHLHEAVYYIYPA